MPSSSAKQRKEASMKAIKRYIALFLVFIPIVAGVLLLIVDFETVKASCLSIAGAFVCIGIGLVLGHILDRKHLLPE